MSYELFKQGPAVWVPLFLISLIVTLVAYGLFPIIFACTRKHPVIKKKYRRYCYAVNAVVMLLFIVVNASSNGYPYLLWTEIFVRIGLKMLERKGFVVNHEACIYLHSNINVSSESSGHCSACGALLVAESSVCDNCGAKIDRVVETQLKHVKTREGFVDSYGWAAEISNLSTDEIYRRYKNKEEWSKDYRALCYEELTKRNENNQQ